MGLSPFVDYRDAKPHKLQEFVPDAPPELTFYVRRLGDRQFQKAHRAAAMESLKRMGDGVVHLDADEQGNVRQVVDWAKVPLDAVANLHESSVNFDGAFYSLANVAMLVDRIEGLTDEETGDKVNVSAQKDIVALLDRFPPLGEAVLAWAREDEAGFARAFEGVLGNSSSGSGRGTEEREGPTH